MKIVKENLNENRLKPWTYTADEIYDVAYELMMNGYLEGWEAADIKSALLYADGETIGDAPYIFTMIEEDDEDEYDDYDESLNENRSRFKSWTDAYTEFMKIVDKYFPDEDRIETEIENLNLKYGGNDRNFDEAYRRWCEKWDSRNEDNYDDFDEALNENMNNMDKVLDSKEANPVTTFPITMTDAIEKNKELEKQSEDIKKEQEKILNNKRYFLGAEKQPTPKDVEDPKPLTLDEGLFNESSKDIMYIIVDKHGNQLSRPNTDDNELWDRVESMDPRGARGLKVIVYTGKDINETLLSSRPLYEQAENIADYLSEFLDSVSRLEDLDDYLDEYDLEHLGKSMDALYDFAYMYSQAANVNEAVKPGTKLGPRKSKLPREKEKKEEWDEWTTVMEELVPSEMLYKFKEVSKFPDIRPKARYDADSVSVDYDGNVEIYADDVEKFDFAKKVAEAYNLKTDEPKPRIRGNGFTMKIYMPEVKDE